jgi:hypothetical protein
MVGTYLTGWWCRVGLGQYSGAATFQHARVLRRAHNHHLGLADRAFPPGTRLQFHLSVILIPKAPESIANIRALNTSWMARLCVTRGDIATIDSLVALGGLSWQDGCMKMLTGKTALVTGGSRGIGAAIVRGRLASMLKA